MSSEKRVKGLTKNQDAVIIIIKETKLMKHKMYVITEPVITAFA